MKRLLVATAISAACFSFSASSSENETTGPYVKLGVNYFDFSGDRRIDSESDFYFGAGYQISDNWGAEFEYTDLDTETNLNMPFEIDLWSINAIYRPNPRGTSSVFWKMGLGRYGMLNDDETVGRFGLGYDFSVNDSFSWVLGADTTLSSGGDADLIGYAGINYFFGQTSSKPTPKAPPAPVVAKPKDSDGDGVIDMNDQCKTTAPNTPVDSKGCELDSDNDGVVDSIDKCPTTPAGAKVDAAGCRIILTEDVSIKLNVQFANNSNAITESYRQEIEKVANFMQQYPDTTVVIEGHTDDRGAASYNQQLSQKRAAAVMQYLVDTFSVESSRLSAVGKGESTPIADNNTAEGRSTNRRVQAEIKTSVSKPQ
jgi:OOP family OmpA-OmpF porin